MSIQEKIALVVEYHKKAEAYCDSRDCGDCVFWQERGFAGVAETANCGTYENPSEKEFETVMNFNCKEKTK